MLKDLTKGWGGGAEGVRRGRGGGKIEKLKIKN